MNEMHANIWGRAIQITQFSTSGSIMWSSFIREEGQGYGRYWQGRDQTVRSHQGKRFEGSASLLGPVFSPSFRFLFSYILWCQFSKPSLWIVNQSGEFSFVFVLCLTLWREFSKPYLWILNHLEIFPMYFVVSLIRQNNSMAKSSRMWHLLWGLSLQ